MVKLTIMGLLLLCTVLYALGALYSGRALFRDECDGCDFTGTMILALNIIGTIVAGYGVYYVACFFELG